MGGVEIAKTECRGDAIVVKTGRVYHNEAAEGVGVGLIKAAEVVVIVCGNGVGESAVHCHCVKHVFIIRVACLHTAEVYYLQHVESFIFQVVGGVQKRPGGVIEADEEASLVGGFYNFVDALRGKASLIDAVITHLGRPLALVFIVHRIVAGSDGVILGEGIEVKMHALHPVVDQSGFQGVFLDTKLKGGESEEILIVKVLV